MSMQIVIEGLDKIESMVDPQRLGIGLDQALQRSAQVWRDDTKKMPPVSASRTGYGAKGIPVAPKHGGTLRQMIQSRRVSSIAAEVFGGAQYTPFVHEGTSKMPARPFFEWSLTVDPIV